MENREIFTKIKNCQTIEELKTIGKEIGYELTDEEAKAYFEKLSKEGELNDDELDSVTGGCTWWRKGRAYSGVDPHNLIVTIGNSCSLWKDGKKSGIRGTCYTCHHCSLGNYGLTRYCWRRRYYDDPLNP